MNLRSIIRAGITTINPDIDIEVLRSDGYTEQDDGTQVPAYRDPVMRRGQVQSLGSNDLQKMAGLNIQGDLAAVYMNGRWDGVVRADQKGGDLLKFHGRTWLVTRVLENWPDWSKLAVTAQNSA